MNILLLTLLIGQIFATSNDVKNTFDAAIQKSIDEHCPFYDMKGLHKLCTKSVPTTKKIPVMLGTGWDPLKAEIKLPFFKFSYEKNKVYVINNESKWYFPDQIDIITKNISNYNVTTNIFTNVDQYLQQMNPNRSNIASGTLALPLDMIPNFFHFFQTGTSNIASVSEIINVYDLKFSNSSKNPEISPFVSEMINSLPKEFDPIIYSMFIDYIGTEIVINAQVGGSAHQTVMSKTCFGGIDLTSQAALYMEKTFHPEQYSHVDFSAGFTQYSKASIIDVYGGDPRFVDPSEWKNRTATIVNYPVLTNVIVKPITDFIIDPIIRKNIQMAIDTYYAAGNSKLTAYKQAYLDSLKGLKTITFVSVANPPNVVMKSQSIILPTGGNSGVEKTPYDKWTPTTLFEAFSCFRTSDSTVRSFVDGDFVNYLNERILRWERSSIRITGSSGADVAFGCSASSYTLNIGHLNSLAPPHTDFSIVGYCCMDCIPDIKCDANGCHFYGCGCPPF